MTSNIQISGKANNGLIFVVGGDNYDDFFVNLAAVLKDAETAEATIREAGRLIVPPTVGGAAQLPAADWQPAPQAQPQQQYQQQAAPAGAPGQAPLCPNHQQPARWVAPGVSQGTGKPYSGFFTCAIAQKGDRSCRLPR